MNEICRTVHKAVLSGFDMHRERPFGRIALEAFKFDAAACGGEFD